ncbi:hypothetical protein [Streptomyces reticuli]|uniref:hypothetical protein n=1 Tax=Streptomyces reticuli TaxID=1926 RepID=UPI00073DE6DB|nr:hypothetical protein [Streptomyces sp. SID7810]CUW31715.1 hypothetical protein TUE45_06464 [Streptomyces reticuli]
MTVNLSRLNTPLPAVEADAALQALLAAPPAGHTPSLQPADWYERVFDAMACAHPDRCTCTQKEAP